MAVKLTEQTNGPHIFMRLRLDSGRVEEIDAYISEEGWRYVTSADRGGTTADHCGVSYAVLTCFLYISRGGCRFSASSPIYKKDVI